MKTLRTLTAVLAAAFLPLQARAEDSASPRGFVLAVHGGAGDYGSDTKERLDVRRSTITKAVDAGRDVLAKGGTSLDAVEAILVVMEDSGLFDAGKGAYYTREGVPELDASIMDGKTLGAGSVAAVKRVKNPIRLARLVMEKTPHVLLVGAGADDFARAQGAALVSPFYFYNEREWSRFQKKQEAEEKRPTDLKGAERGHGTVGAVVLDRAGNLAAGTSTGGTTWKLPGRVGDSPIIGAGTYASNESCAVSGTGLGEFFMRNVVASDIAARVKYLKQSLKDAADDVVMKELVAQKGEGGVIALDRKGNVAMPFNTNGMLRAVLREGGAVEVKVFHAE